MSKLLMVATFQAAVYGPVVPSRETPFADSPPEAKGCEKTIANEIVVCKKNTIVTNQTISPLAKPTDKRLNLDEQGLFRLKLGKNSELNGGGPKGSLGLGFRLHF